MPSEQSGRMGDDAPGRSRTTPRRCRAALPLLLALLAMPAVAQDGAATLKAAFLFNFALYTEWPALGPRFELCAVGGELLGESLEQLESKAVAGRPIRVRHVSGGRIPEDCNLVYLSSREATRAPRWLKPLAGQPVLTVADVADGAGGKPGTSDAMLQFRLVGDRLVFDANPAAASEAGLTLGAKLLRSASSIQ